MLEFYGTEQMAKQRTELLAQRAEANARLLEAGWTPGPGIRERLGLALMALGRRIDPSVAVPCDPAPVAVTVAS